MGVPTSFLLRPGAASSVTGAISSIPLRDTALNRPQQARRPTDLEDMPGQMRLLPSSCVPGWAEGVLAEARECSRAGHSPWNPTWPACSQGRQVLSGYGELVVLTRSASALADQPLDAVHSGLAGGDDLIYDEYAEIPVLVALAEAATFRAPQECGGAPGNGHRLATERNFAPHFPRTRQNLRGEDDRGRHPPQERPRSSSAGTVVRAPYLSQRPALRFLSHLPAQLLPHGTDHTVSGRSGLLYVVQVWT